MEPHMLVFLFETMSEWQFNMSHTNSNYLLWNILEVVVDDDDDDGYDADEDDDD